MKFPYQIDLWASLYGILFIIIDELEPKSL